RPQVKYAAPFAALLCSLVLAIFEFARNPNLHTLPWSPIGLKRLAIYAAVSCGIALLWRPVRRIAPHAGVYLATVALVYGLAAIGPGPFLAVVFCGAAGVAVGSLVLGDALACQPGEIALTFCLGEGLLGFAASLLGRTYFCFPAVFFILLAAPILA